MLLRSHRLGLRSLPWVLAAAVTWLPTLAIAQPAQSAQPSPAAPEAGPPAGDVPGSSAAPPPVAATPQAPPEEVEIEAGPPSAQPAAPLPEPSPLPSPSVLPPAATTLTQPPEPWPSTSADAALAVSLADGGYPLTPGVTADPIRDDFALSGYMQGQYESHQDSVDQLRQGGTLLNQDRFVLRRGRIKVARDWDFAQVMLELDGNTVRGPTMRVQKAEASLIYRRSTDKDQPPIAQLTLGQFDLPFGFEMTYVPKVRWFMERTTASRALFPGEPDLGARFSGGIGFARYSVAITNGEPLDEKTAFSLQDPNANKDVTARLGAESKIAKTVVLAGGISFNRGKGLSSSGTDATKSAVIWRDANENGNVDPGEIMGQAANAAKRSLNFSRWAVGADIELLLETAFGWSMLYGELTAASNLDRGLFIADPVLNGTAVRELGYYVAFTQEVTRYGAVGFRYELYDPNSDLIDKRANRLLPASQQIHTYSPMAALVLPKRARLVFQWDIIRDYMARDTRGVPTDFKNNQWTLRLQVVL